MKTGIVATTLALGLLSQTAFADTLVVYSADRRTFITTLAAKGIGVRVLASLAGHRSITITQAYIDVNDDMRRQAVELV